MPLLCSSSTDDGQDEFSSYRSCRKRLSVQSGGIRDRVRLSRDLDDKMERNCPRPRRTHER